jgi:hypothetical protein
MPSAVCENMVNLIASLSIRRCPSKFMNVTMWKHRTSRRYLDMTKVSTPLSLLILCKLSFPIVGLKMSSLPALALKSSNTIFMAVAKVTSKYMLGLVGVQEVRWDSR